MLIDLNTIGNESEEPAEQKEKPQEAVCLELWHACAGMRVSLPRKGSLLVYLPQGHLEQLAGGGDDLLLRYGVPPHVFLRVVDVQLRAEPATDEIYAQLYVIADGEEGGRHIQEGSAEREGEELDDMDNGIKYPHMFCKTLPASSTHGDLCVPCRFAADCFPELDYEQEKPSQELVAKDLHGVEWHFRHVFRGKPRRHLLTTGWSAFINSKKLVSGDAVLFFRGDDGKLRLGIRRASQIKGRISHVICPSQSLNAGIDSLQSLANSIFKRNIFQISYYPRVNQSEFVVPYWKFRKSCSYSIPVGTRFKMRFRNEDATERRFTGLITGVSDFDPVRWPGSKWRNLEVKWDDKNSVGNNGHNRVSPWEIDPNGNLSSPNNLIISGSKRKRATTPSINADYPHPSESGHHNMGESVRLHKVFQGQEIKAPFNGGNATLPQVSELRNDHFSGKRICSANPSSFWLADSGGGTRYPAGNSDLFYNGKSARSHKVLQGQEMVQVCSPFRVVVAESQSENGGFKTLKSCVAERSSSKPHEGSSSAQLSSPSSVLMSQKPNSQFRRYHSLHESNDREKTEDIIFFDPLGSHKASCPHQISSRPCYLEFDFGKEHQEIGTSFTRPIEKNSQSILRDSDSSCRLFGFPLTEKIPVANIVAGSLSDIAVSGDGTRDSPGRTSSAQVSSPSSVLMFQQPASRLPSSHSLHETDNEKEKSEDINSFDPFGSFNASGQQETSGRSRYPRFGFSKERYENETSFTRTINEKSLSILRGSDSSSRLFGFSLTENIPVGNVITESSISRQMPRISAMPAQEWGLSLVTCFRNPTSTLL